MPVPLFAVILAAALAWLPVHPPTLDPLPRTGLAVTLLLRVLVANTPGARHGT